MISEILRRQVMVSKECSSKVRTTDSSSNLHIYNSLVQSNPINLQTINIIPATLVSQNIPIPELELANLSESISQSQSFQNTSANQLSSTPNLSASVNLCGSTSSFNLYPYPLNFFVQPATNAQTLFYEIHCQNINKDE